MEFWLFPMRWGIHSYNQDCSAAYIKQDPTYSTCNNLRLDFFLVDEGLRGSCKRAGQCGGWISSWSDHRKVELKLDLDNIQRGKGYWKLNNSYLNEKEYVSQIKQTLSQAIWELQAAKGTGNPEMHTLTSIQNMTPLERSLIQVRMNPHQLLEWLLYKFRETSQA
jgi:hypothetical protein